MVNLSPLVCLTYFIFLKIYQNMTATNSAKLRNLFHIASNLKKTLFSIDFYVIALFEKSELISNWRSISTS